MTNIMLQLVNIKKTDRYIQADYFPENRGLKGFARIDLVDGSETSIPAKGYERTYPRHALNGLEKILKDEKQGIAIPSEKLIMWY